MLALELTHVVTYSRLYSLATTFAFIVAGFLMMAFSSASRAR